MMGDILFIDRRKQVRLEEGRVGDNHVVQMIGNKLLYRRMEQGNAVVKRALLHIFTGLVKCFRINFHCIDHRVGVALRDHQ
ncbi:hypothetical protein D3C86_1750240 [compost metagenome]